VAVAVVDVQVNSQGAVRNLRQVNAASKAATASIGTLRNAVAGLAAGFGAIQAAKFVFAKTAATWSSNAIHRHRADRKR
jgi:hypothetical protein